MPPDDPNAKPDENDADIVFNPNEPRGDMGMTMEDAEDYITKLEAENKHLEAENLRIISHRTVADPKFQDQNKVIAGLMEQNQDLTRDRDNYKVSADNWRREFDKFVKLNSNRKIAAEVGFIALGIAVLSSVGLADVWSNEAIEKQERIHQLTQELQQARVEVPEAEAIATNSEMQPDVVVTGERESIALPFAKLIAVEKADYNWPIIIETEDGRKMRVLVSPALYQSSLAVPQIELPRRRFKIMEYVVIDPTWQDPDSEYLEEPLFKFSLDDYVRKKKPTAERAEY